jgi:hypothetical protein
LLAGYTSTDRGLFPYRCQSGLGFDIFAANVLENLVHYRKGVFMSKKAKGIGIGIALTAVFGLGALAVNSGLKNRMQYEPIEDNPVKKLLEDSDNMDVANEELSKPLPVSITNDLDANVGANFCDVAVDHLDGAGVTREEYFALLLCDSVGKLPQDIVRDFNGRAYEERRAMNNVLVNEILPQMCDEFEADSQAFPDMVKEVPVYETLERICKAHDSLKINP